MLMTKKFKEIPYPNTINVFLGNLTQLRKERINFFIRQKKEMGDLYRIKVPTRKVVVVTDPDWIKVREASELDGKILAKAPDRVYMRMTNYSPGN